MAVILITLNYNRGKNLLISLWSVSLSIISNRIEILKKFHILKTTFGLGIGHHI